MYLKLKLEKVEKERNELRLSSDRLESRVRHASFLFDFNRQSRASFLLY